MANQKNTIQQTDQTDHTPLVGWIDPNGVSCEVMISSQILQCLSWFKILRSKYFPSSPQVPLESSRMTIVYFVSWYGPNSPLDNVCINHDDHPNYWHHKSSPRTSSQFGLLMLTKTKRGKDLKRKPVTIKTTKIKKNLMVRISIKTTKK